MAMADLLHLPSLTSCASHRARPAPATTLIASLRSRAFFRLFAREIPLRNAVVAPQFALTLWQNLLWHTLLFVSFCFLDFLLLYSVISRVQELFVSLTLFLKLLERQFRALTRILLSHSHISSENFALAVKPLFCLIYGVPEV